MAEREKLTPPFVPGFLTREDARRAGAKFFAMSDGTQGREGRHFHLVQNEHGRWHFEGGPGPITPSVHWDDPRSEPARVLSDEG